MPNDHRGITLVELIIAIAISTVILGAATLFLGMAHKNYNHASAQIDRHVGDGRKPGGGT